MYDDLDSLRDILWSDVMEAFDTYRKGDSPYNRRVFVRAGICFLEGITFDVRESIARTFDRPHCAAAFTEIERRLLTDRKALEYVYRDLAERFRFCIEMMAKPFYEGVVIDTEKDPGWAAFKRALKVRHRITHPVSATALEIQSSEVLDVGISCHWTTSRGGFVLEHMAMQLDAPKDQIDAIRESRASVDKWLDKYLYRKSTGQ